MYASLVSVNIHVVCLICLSTKLVLRWRCLYTMCMNKIADRSMYYSLDWQKSELTRRIEWLMDFSKLSLRLSCLDNFSGEGNPRSNRIRRNGLSQRSLEKHSVLHREERETTHDTRQHSQVANPYFDSVRTYVARHRPKFTSVTRTILQIDERHLDSALDF